MRRHGTSVLIGCMIAVAATSSCTAMITWGRISWVAHRTDDAASDHVQPKGTVIAACHLHRREGEP